MPNYIYIEELYIPPSDFEVETVFEAPLVCHVFPQGELFDVPIAYVFPHQGKIIEPPTSDEIPIQVSIASDTLDVEYTIHLAETYTTTIDYIPN